MVQGFGIGMLLKRFSEFSLLILAVLISGCAFVLMVGSLRYMNVVPRSTGNTNGETEN